MIRPPRRSTLFPYPTLFRSGDPLVLRELRALVARREQGERRNQRGERQAPGRANSEDDRARGHEPAHQALHVGRRSEEHTSELQSPCNLVCRLLLEKKKDYF